MQPDDSLRLPRRTGGKVDVARTVEGDLAIRQRSGRVRAALCGVVDASVLVQQDLFAHMDAFEAGFGEHAVH